MPTIYHGNPFTHEEHSRESRSAKDMGAHDTQSCAWCGQPRRALYRYDGTRGYFCNLSCWRAYYS